MLNRESPVSSKSARLIVNDSGSGAMGGALASPGAGPFCTTRVTMTEFPASSAIPPAWDNACSSVVWRTAWITMGVLTEPITVIGSVKTPMVIQAVRQTTLLQALSQAGGIAEEAGNSVIVTRVVQKGPAPGDANAPPMAPDPLSFTIN